MELQKFFSLGNMSQIETLNKMLDKIQKILRLRAELISVLASIHSCETMQSDILDMYQIFGQEFDAETAVNILKKIKIYQKAVGISLQQVDRFSLLFNKTVERSKISKFGYSVNTISNEKYDFKEGMSVCIMQTTEIYDQVYSDI